jgi:hypothetical protein
MTESYSDEDTQVPLTCMDIPVCLLARYIVTSIQSSLVQETREWKRSPGHTRDPISTLQLACLPDLKWDR